MAEKRICISGHVDQKTSDKLNKIRKHHGFSNWGQLFTMWLQQWEKRGHYKMEEEKENES